MHDIIVFDNRIIHAFIHPSGLHRVQQRIQHKLPTTFNLKVTILSVFCVIVWQPKRTEASTQGVRLRNNTKIPVQVTVTTVYSKKLFLLLFQCFVVCFKSLYFRTNSGPEKVKNDEEYRYNRTTTKQLLPTVLFPVTPLNENGSKLVECKFVGTCKIHR